MIVGLVTILSIPRKNKCISLISAYFPDPTENINAVYANDVTTYDITVVMSNRVTKKKEINKQPRSLAESVRKMFGPPMPQYLNALTIAASQAIADTGATSIFVMEGVDVENKCPSTKPLTINLPDGRQFKSMQICNINIPGLPTTLTGHIVPNLAIASLFGKRVLCKAGCTVTFNDNKCGIYFKDKLILQGHKDPSTDLWTLMITPKRCGPPQGPQQGARMQKQQAAGCASHSCTQKL
jgi:hypothetical protein